METTERPTQIRLVSSSASKITNVKLYSGWAEITRLFEVEIKVGQNIVSIVGLPWSFQENSVRVESTGNISIHNIAGGATDNSAAQSEKQIRSSLESARRSRSTLDTYLTTITAQDISISRLEEILREYALLCAKLDQHILDLEEKLEAAKRDFGSDTEQTSDEVSTPSWKVTVSLHGEIDEIVKLSITYAVSFADWTPCYEVRVNPHNKEGPIKILYKAVITQATGESWENVPLTLGTITQGFGIEPPTFHPLTIGCYQPPPIQYQPIVEVPHVSPTPILHHDSRSRSRSPPWRQRRRPSSPSGNLERLPTYFSTVRPPIVAPEPPKGDIVATFTIPGLITVPDDQGKTIVTVVELSSKTTLVRYAIPAENRTVHLKARIRNDSEYMFVQGPAHIYVDGSFVAMTKIPSVSPQETFNCPLGPDLSIRVIYPPLEKKTTNSGLVKKYASSGSATQTTSRSYTQRIIVFNTNSIPVQNIQIIDRVPVSADERVVVKILNPALKMPSSSGDSGQPEDGSSSVNRLVFTLVPVSEDVFAHWDGGDEDPALDSGNEDSKIRKNGKYDIIHPENLSIQGV